MATKIGEPENPFLDIPKMEGPEPFHAIKCPRCQGGSRIRGSIGNVELCPACGGIGLVKFRFSALREIAREELS